MSERGATMTIEALEAALLELGPMVDLPLAADLAPTVGARLRARPPSGARDGARGPRIRTALLLSAALTLLLVGTVLGIRVGLDLLDIDFGPVPTPTPSISSPVPSAQALTVTEVLGLGTALTLDDARSAADFPLKVPAALPPPDEVAIGGPVLGGQVAFVYAATADLPSSDLLEGAGLLVTQARGRPDTGLANKLVDSGLASVEPVTVGDDAGYWISGEPHWFWYLAPDGSAIEERRRFVGDTLVWERDGVLYRIEGAVSKADALAIAVSMR
jgi:hypothetical protein